MYKFWLFAALIILSVWLWQGRNKSAYKIGDTIDNLHGVKVFYNGNVDNVSGRNKTKDGYNLGLKYQCVEFVKRYYYEYLKHKMPNSYGHAKDFFNRILKDGQLNEARNLIQYTNGSKTKPKPDDLLVYAGSVFNKYGHVAIISKVTDAEIEIIQQNPLFSQIPEKPSNFIKKKVSGK